VSCIHPHRSSSTSKVSKQGSSDYWKYKRLLYLTQILMQLYSDCFVLRANSLHKMNLSLYNHSLPWPVIWEWLYICASRTWLAPIAHPLAIQRARTRPRRDEHSCPDPILSMAIWARHPGFPSPTRSDSKIATSTARKEPAQSRYQTELYRRAAYNREVGDHPSIVKSVRS
jgi:hypothetical protein